MSILAIQQAVEEAGLVRLAANAAEQFDTYLTLLLKWNARLNLTAVREPADIIRRHFIECIQCAQNLPTFQNHPTLLDFGSGAGLPGIPIAICCPEIRVTLAESQRKKAAFLREAARVLGLDVEIYDGRVEDMPSDRGFDFVTLRAVDKMIEACRAGLIRVTAGGWIIPFATKSGAGAIKNALPGIEWRRELPVAGSDQAILLYGKRPA